MTSLRSRPTDRARFPRAIAFASAAIAFWMMTAAVQAEASTSNEVAAEALFDRGVALMKEGKYAEGCAQLEQSQAIDRGIGTMLYLAECYERLGRIASAWALFREAASAARAEGQIERADMGTARAAKLEPRLSKLTLQVAAGNTMPGFTVQFNGVTLSSSVWGVPMPVDPGDNRIEAHAPGYLDFSLVQPVTVEAATILVSVPVLDRAPQAASAEASPVPAPAAVAVSASPSPSGPLAQPPSDASSQRAWQRPLALVVGGVGVVGLGLGTYFGLHAISKDSSADSLCQSSAATCADAHGAQLSKEANDAAKLSNGFLIGGAILAAAGVVLYFTAPSQAGPALAFGGDAHSVRVSLGGAL